MTADPRPSSDRPDPQTTGHPPLQDGTSISRIVSFRLADEEYGFDIRHVREIILVGDITRVVSAPDYVRGLIRLRGNVIPVVDLRERLGLPPTDYDDRTRIMVLNVSGQTLGVIVDAVHEVRQIDPDQIEVAPTGTGDIDRGYIAGIVNTDEKLIILLRTGAIVETAKRTDAGESEGGPPSETEPLET